MTIFLILDFLLLLLILTFTPIGFWRGPIKELFVTLGILFGVLLITYWARPWGNDLASFTSLTEGAAAFIVAMCFLISSTFILGYGLGAALGPAFHSMSARVLGGFVAALNGALLLSFALQYVRLYLLSDSNETSLKDSFVAQFLLNQVGWIVMLATVVAIPLLLYILISGRRAYEVLYDDEAEAQPARLPRGADMPPRVPVRGQARQQTGYKAEPRPRRPRPVSETRAIAVDRPEHTAEPATAPRDMGDTDPHIVIPQEAKRDLSQPLTVPLESEEHAPDAADRCRNCHAVLPADAEICPNCGTMR